MKNIKLPKHRYKAALKMLVMTQSLDIHLKDTEQCFLKMYQNVQLDREY